MNAAAKDAVGQGSAGSSRRRRASPPVVLALLALVPAVALAYVRAITEKSQTPLRWKGSNCVVLRPNVVGTPDVPGSAELDAIARAVDNWHQVIADCSYLRIQLKQADESSAIALDRTGPNENAVLWVEKAASSVCSHDDQCSAGQRCQGCPSSGCQEPEGGCCPEGEHCWIHDPSAAAITTVFYVDGAGKVDDGRILDADIELNGTTFTFSTDGARDRTDVENTITHELGHVMGLDHPCDDGSRDPLPSDDRGQALPSCVPSSALPAAIKETTMYNFAAPGGETKKRTPEADDVRGICETYPKVADPGVCAPVDLTPRSGCVACDLGDGAAPLTAALVVLALLGWRRARRARAGQRAPIGRA